jgi:hypothetical protein
LSTLIGAGRAVSRAEENEKCREKQWKISRFSFDLMPLDVVDVKFHISVIIFALNLKEFFGLLL